MLSGLVIIGILFTGLLLMICFIILLRFRRVNENYIKKAKDELNGEKYVAVVLTNKSPRDESFIYPSGIMFLIKHLEKSKKPYKLMKRFDFDKFKEFVYDTNCRGLYIIGHGTRHSLDIGKGKTDVLEYGLFKGYNHPPKDFVVQLHCNNDGGESLADIIAPNTPRSYVSDSYRCTVDNLFYFISLDQPPMLMTISLATVIFASTIIGSIAKILHVFRISLHNLPKLFLNTKEADKKKSKACDTCS